MKNSKSIALTSLAFLVGVLVTFLMMKQCSTDNTAEQSHVIAYQIQRMNKMIVAEQNYSDIYSYQSKKSFPGFERFYSADKKITMLINAKAQATYDLSKMNITIDSIQKKIILKDIPAVEIKIYPDVQFHDLDQSMFNKFEKDELNGIKKRGIQHVEKIINKTELKKQAHEQLIQNLGEIYAIAKLYNWEVVDETPYAKETKALSDRAK
ncbi:DUF4230 domain-containing protein [Weeksella virosa]|uniref:DUF4230 domain-containing protein n=2 Tax=Weeksella virosa TaxID=1014 RepID=F0P0L5_WEEVC|nr:DUF4230 domain-containing protein [Weeksella virosa]ADX68514.1 hypothetical protein Weevi_1824 [Weeksella virosa DSM 16922]MDK7375424.1 DUF4230 domain-containing protein [Weeksella virosa]MDK7675315.1 DUF4230 domain-containing protein [Weeksella virosa]